MLGQHLWWRCKLGNGGPMRLRFTPCLYSSSNKWGWDTNPESVFLPRHFPSTLRAKTGFQKDWGNRLLPTQHWDPWPRQVISRLKIEKKKKKTTLQIPERQISGLEDEGGAGGMLLWMCLGRECCFHSLTLALDFLPNSPLWVGPGLPGKGGMCRICFKVSCGNLAQQRKNIYANY